jgi:Kef-type K+ transport system membrane component KefB
VYLLGRSVGKYLGAWLGARIAASDTGVRRWLGMALLPQAGVPIGMALVAANQFPEYRQVLLSVVVSSTVLFDIVGPLLARLAITRADGGRSQRSS